MADVYIDRLDNLSAKESHGVVRQLTRKARVVFKNPDALQTSYDILGAALSFLDAQGFGAMSTLNLLDDPQNRWGALTLVRREPSLAFPDSHNCVDVVLDYQHLLDGANQLFQPAMQTIGGAVADAGNLTGSIFGKGRCSIVDKTTNFYYPNGDRTKPKRQIAVSHRFPLWETGIAATAFDKDYPRCIFQGGEVNIPFPQSNYGFSLIVTTDSPVTIANTLVASINAKPLLGQKELTWICSEVRWECNAPAGNPFAPATTYNMSFEFQNNVDGWDPTVVFLDHRTSRPPSGVEFANTNDLDGVLSLYTPSDPAEHPLRPFRPAGIWQVPALPRIDFVDYFNTLFR